MGIMDTIKQTTPQDLMLTSVFAGADAGILGYLDSLNLNRDAIYNRGRNKKEKFINGALFMESLHSLHTSLQRRYSTRHLETRT